MDGFLCLEGTGMTLSGQWASAQSVEKVEEMLGRAIIHQEDLWGMLMLHSHDGACVDFETGLITTELIPPTVFRALKAKLENSMDWCQLALCRLKEIVIHSKVPAQAACTGLVPQVSRFPVNMSSSLVQPKVEPLAVNYTSSKLKLNKPLSPLRVPLRTENLLCSPRSLLSTPFCYPGAVKSGSGPSPLTSFVETAEPILSVPSLVGADMEHREGQNFADLLLDSGWELPISSTPLPPNFTGLTIPDGSSSSQITLDAPARTRKVADTAENTVSLLDAGGSLNQPSEVLSNCRRVRPKRPTSSVGRQKRDREASEKDPKPAVIYQRITPGADSKKGIPDDGHRGWKKYGNKSIQNASFCRGYYKCSLKECPAKKMVKQMDNDPSTFEVIYVGNHTCSSALTKKRQHRSSRVADVQVEVCMSSPEDCKQLDSEKTETDGSEVFSSTVVSPTTESQVNSQMPRLGAGHLTGSSDLDSMEGQMSTESSRGSDDWTFPSEEGEGDIESFLDPSPEEQVNIIGKYLDANTSYFNDSLLWQDMDSNLSGQFASFNVSPGFPSYELHAETSMITSEAP